MANGEDLRSAAAIYEDIGVEADTSRGLIEDVAGAIGDVATSPDMLPAVGAQIETAATEMSASVRLLTYANNSIGDVRTKLDEQVADLHAVQIAIDGVCTDVTNVASASIAPAANRLEAAWRALGIAHLNAGRLPREVASGRIPQGLNGIVASTGYMDQRGRLARELGGSVGSDLSEKLSAQVTSLNETATTARSTFDTKLNEGCRGVATACSDVQRILVSDKVKPRLTLERDGLTEAIPVELAKAARLISEAMSLIMGANATLGRAMTANGEVGEALTNLTTANNSALRLGRLSTDIINVGRKFGEPAARQAELIIATASDLAALLRGQKTG